MATKPITKEELYDNPVFSQAMKEVPEDKRDAVEQEMLKLANWLAAMAEGLNPQSNSDR